MVDTAFHRPAWSRRQVMQGWAAGAMCALWPARGGAVPSLLTQHPWLQPLLSQGGYSLPELSALLTHLAPYPEVVRAMDSQAEALPWHRYRARVVTAELVAAGHHHLKAHRPLLERIQGQYGVPGAVVVALWGMESRFGAHQGRHPVLRTLWTLATGYPRRATLFRQQLVEFLLLCREQGWDPQTIQGSYAGAFGQTQMIPGTFRSQAVDFDNDGRRDVFSSVPDTLASIANFLKNHGWEPGGAYTLPLRTTPGLADQVTKDLERMQPWEFWRNAGVRTAPGSSEPGLQTPAALIMLEELSMSGEGPPKDEPVYHLAFNNFRVVTRWNNSRRFAMAVGEVFRAIGEERS
ncbi:MAG: lytic murein transglycosylase [Magnetococcus sp. WYHC-3]